MKKRLEFLIAIILLISVNTITAQSKIETEKKQTINSTSVSSALEVVPESFNYVNIPIDEDKSWWNNWPRFTYYGRDVNKVVLTKSNAMTVVHGLQDEGRAPFFRDHVLVHEPVNTEYIQQLDIKIMAWLEGMGEAREFLIALHKNENGTYEWDNLTNTSKVIAHPWTWDILGPGVNADANTIKWAGTASFVNDPYWQKPKGIPEDMALPTYPDGSSAIGYTNDDDSDPRNALVYDAIACKNINGDISVVAASNSSNNQVGKVDYTSPKPGGASLLVDDMHIKKDMASPWWVERNIYAAKYFIEEHNVDGFWIDNYTGWDFMGNNPVENAFGEWTVASFRDYLKDNPVNGETYSADYDVRDALKARFLNYFSSADPGDLKSTVTRANWLSSIWIYDALWRAFKSHKAKIANNSMIRLYEGIKEGATELGKNADNILVSGNDLPSINFGSFKGNSIDISSSEYSPSFHRITHGLCDGIPPYGHSTPLYALSTSFTKSHIASVWYYLEGIYTEQRGKPGIGELLGYEALTGNVSLNLGEQQPRLPGNDESTRIINTTIEKMAPLFGQRSREGKVGVYYSTDTEYLYLTPNGFAFNGKVPAVAGYYGWCTALERLHIPYRAIPDFKLSSDYIESLSVLILPNVESISSDKIDQVIVPFIENGGSVIITGDNSGLYQGTEQGFSKNNSPLLYDLTENTYVNGNVIFIENSADMEFYIDHLSSVNNYGSVNLTVLKTEIDGLINLGALERQTELLNFKKGTVRAIMNADKKRGRWFVDLLNTDINLTTDIITPSEGGTIILTIPDELGNKVTFSFYDTDLEDPYILTAVERDDGRVELTIPEFRIYGSLVIENAIDNSIHEAGTKSNSDLILYPNPSSDEINIAVENDIINVKLYSISGQLLHNSNYNNNKKNRISMNISEFEKGVYLLKVTTKAGVSFKRFVKI